MKWKVLSKLLSCLPIGRLMFRSSIIVKKISAIGSSNINERAIEYPWLLKQLKLIKKGSLVLDIGCAESVLSHELVGQKFEVVGIDIRKYLWKNKFMHFLRANCTKSCVRENIFDAIVMISTIEHIALFHERYCQKIFDDEGDIKVMKELQRILKPRGILILTTPFIGKNKYRVCKTSRFYNLERLNRLIKGFQKIKSEYYITDKKQKSYSKIPGVACLILQKS